MEGLQTKISMAQLVQHPEKLNGDTVELLKRMVDRYPYCQTARLLLLQNLYKEKSPLFQKELRRSAVMLNDRSVLFNMVEALHYKIDSSMSSEEPLQEVADENDQTLSLIDNFLKSVPVEPVAKSPRKATAVDATTDYVSYLLQEEGDEAEMAVMSQTSQFGRSSRIQLQEKEKYEVPEDVEPQKEEFFTETLAKIYMKQQKYDRALEIIRALSADNPKKNSYFASQIRYLEKLIEINNNKS